MPERAQLGRFATRDRVPFYAVAARYLPDDPAATVVDIGAGHGDFARYAGLAARFARCYLLDANSASVSRLAEIGGKALCYSVPDPLPFPDEAVEFIHCSHLVEHLSPAELYALIGEWDRVLRPGGVLVVSAPLLWAGFYVDLTHVRPYGAEVFLKYLGGSKGVRSREVVSAAYTAEELVYRYDAGPVLGGVRATHAWSDWLLLGLTKLIWAAGFRRVEVSGFTLVLRKGGRSTS